MKRISCAKERGIAFGFGFGLGLGLGGISLLTLEEVLSARLLTTWLSSNILRVLTRTPVVYNSAIALI